MNILIAGVGHFSLRDLRFGQKVVEKIKLLNLPSEIEVEDASYGAIAFMHKLQEKKYDKIIFVGAIQKDGKPGTVYKYKPTIDITDEAQIQARIEESLEGVISLDHILVICKFYKFLPEEVIVIGVEPEEYQSYGLKLSQSVRAVLEHVVHLVLQEAGFQ